MDLLLAILGALTGFFSGLLGIGGGIVMGPLLIYAPPYFGYPELPMRLVAGLTIVQGLAACVAGGLTHRKFNFVSRSLTAWMGTTIFAAALLGGGGSQFLSNRILLAIFAALAFLAALLLFLPTRRDCELPALEQFTFRRGRAIAAAAAVGLLGGLVGQGGSFILIPLMTAFVQVPTRIAIGSNLPIIFLGTAAAFLGKAATGQIPWRLTLPILLTVIPATYLGGQISRRLPIAKLRLVLAAIVTLAACRIAYSVWSN